MVRMRGRGAVHGRGGVRRGVGGRVSVGRGGAVRGGAVRGARGGPRGNPRPGRGGFQPPLMGRPMAPPMQPMGYGEPEYGFMGPRIPPPMIPPPIPGPRAMMPRPYPPTMAPHPVPPFPQPRPFHGDFPVRHPMGLRQLPRPMVPPVPPFVRGRGGFRGGIAKTGKPFNNGMIKAKTNKKKNTKNKRNEEAEANKPWVNNALKVEIQKKHSLFEEASRKHNDTVCWKAYNDQKAFVANLVKAAKLEYIGSHSEEEVAKIPELKPLLEAKKKENVTTEVAATA